MKSENFDKLKAEAVETVIYWGKTRIGLYPMRNAVNTYMEACGANQTICGEEGIKERRKIVANGITISCVAFLTKEQLYKVEMELKRIANNSNDHPIQKPSLRR